MADETPILEPQTDAPSDPLAPDTLPWSPEHRSAWLSRVKLAKEKQALWHAWWDKGQQAYSQQVGDDIEGYAKNVSTKRVFTIVERKLAELFYQKPELAIGKAPLLEELGEPGTLVAQTHGDILNEKIGLDGVDVKRLAQRANFDYLFTSIGWTVMGYRAYQKAMQQTVTEPVMDPITGQPAVDGMGQPLMAQRQVPQKVTIKSECFWENISPKQALVPADWKSGDFDKAPWLGWRFKLSLNEARKLYELPDDYKGSTANTSDMEFDHQEAASDKVPSTDIVTGTQLWYRACVFTDEVHPDALNELVLLDGLDDPVKHEPFALQKFDDRGRLTPDSFIGYPMHPLQVRTQTDAAYLMPDVSHWQPLESELNKFRTQRIIQRQINLVKFFYDTGKIGKDDLDKLVSACQGGMIGLPSTAFAGGPPIVPIEHGATPQEDFVANKQVDDDLARASAVDETAAGTNAEGGITATESNIRQANVNIRLGWEQGFVADWFVKGATKYSCIVQQFLPVEDAAQIVGSQRAQLWDQLRHHLPARFAFTMTPDSSLRNDTPLDRKQHMDLFTYSANDPTVNRRFLMEKLFEKFHIDPTRAMLPQAQVPQPKPEPPKLSLTFKGEDLNPMMPQAPIVMDLLTKLGVQIDPQAISNAMVLGQLAMAAQASKPQTDDSSQPPHGGKVAQMESLDKHANDLTGGQNATGEMLPGMGGGVN